MRPDHKLIGTLGAGACLLALGIGLVATQPAKAWLVQGSGAPATFTSAGDVTAFTSWWGASFAYSAATRNTKAVQLCQPAGSNCVDVNSDATTGITTNAPTVNGSACDNASHKCFVGKVYDKVGTKDMVQATGANQPTWVVDGGPHAGIPCMSFTRASSLGLGTTTGASMLASWIISAVMKRNLGQSANQNAIYSDATTVNIMYHEASANNVTLYGGGATVVTVALTDNTWGAAAGVGVNVGNSYLNVNGTTATNAIGASTINATQTIGSSNGGLFYDGMICEVGAISTDNSTAHADSLVTNQRSALRYNF